MDFGTWSEVELKKEVTICIECGKKIWALWHVDKNPMVLCGPCFFEDRKEGDKHGSTGAKIL